MSTPDDILPTYDRLAADWDQSRDRRLFERAWLDRMLAHAPGRSVLDLGCGAGRPIAAYLADRGRSVTGVDAAPAMIALFRRNVPRAEAVLADMRGLDLGRRFDAILAWDSFFHLAPQAQRAMFAVFARHADPGAVLMFTTGPAAGEVIGALGAAPLYHASLDPDDYEGLLAGAGFELLAFVPEDPACEGHSVWMARRLPG